MNARYEFWVRFAFGATVGFFVGGYWWIDGFMRMTGEPWEAVVVIGLAMVIFGLLAARFGDKFWYEILTPWWW